MRAEQENNKRLEKVFNEIVGRHIRNARTERGWTQAKLAEETGGDEKHIGKIERAHKVPGGFTLFNILVELDLQPHEIYEEFKEAKRLFEQEE